LDIKRAENVADPAIPTASLPRQSARHRVNRQACAIRGGGKWQMSTCSIRNHDTVEET